jgi:ERCC4-type nuclease
MSQPSGAQLLLDDRIGSRDLLPRMRKLGVSARLVHLDFADAAFVGRGVEERPWQVGVELKTISDLCNCILTGRLAAHQIPGLLRDYDDAWLVIEGRWRCDNAGVLLVENPHQRGGWYPLAHGRQRWMLREVQGYLLTIAMLAGIRIWHVADRDETARFVAGLFNWWTGKALAEHAALHSFQDYKARVSTRADGRGMDSAMLVAPSFLRRVTKEFPGLGWQRSQDVEKYFPSVRAAVNAPASQWMEIPGIGATIADKIVKAVNGGKA